MSEERVRNYAMGNQDIAKYKELFKPYPKPDKKDYVKIDWRSPRNFMKKYIAKFWSRQPMKSYRMINRLKKCI